MGDRRLAKALLEAARRDAEVLPLLRDPASASEEVFGFHVQQAVEKALKARLGIRGARYPLTHNVETLLILLAEAGVDEQRYWNLTEYSPFAVEFRYHGLEPEHDSVDRGQAIALVEELLATVQKELHVDKNLDQ